MIDLENRQFERVKAKSVLVALENGTQQISGFLRDISEGGIKIQKISAGRQVEPGEYLCRFVLPDLGKIEAKVEVIGAGDIQEKFGDMLIRMRFHDLTDEVKEKIKQFVEQSVSS